jgi:hypothetical protein
MEDQQAIKNIIFNQEFGHIAHDTSPSNLNLTKLSRERRQSPFVFTFFPQIDIWGGHIAYWNREDVTSTVTPYVWHMNACITHDKIPKLKGLGLWMVENTTCRYDGPGIYKTILQPQDLQTAE